MTTETLKLRPYLDRLEVGNPMGHLNLSLLPLSGDGQKPLEYMLASIAIRTGHLKVSEVGAAGTVPELWVESTCPTMILLIDGEELVGAKQNRILNTSVLVPPKTKMAIPVSCVEQGRWNYTSSHFASGCQSPSKLRARKSRDVQENLRRSGRHDSDQGAVWEEVAYCARTLGASSPTMAMHDMIEQKQTSLKGYTEALKYPGRARGVVVAINGQFAALDLFDKPETLELIWDRLVSGYALDALGGAERNTQGMSGKAVEVLLERAGGIACQAFPSVGVGQDWRFEAEDLVGQALVADSACVHLCVFPNENRNQRSGNDRQSQIVPPSRRRRRQHPGSPDV